jgi:DNA replication protein DnaC
MSTRSDDAAQAAIGAAARELHLPTVRAGAARLAEMAVRERQSHLAFLAEVLTAEIDDRTERRRTRRIAEAKFPRLKRLSEFNVDAMPTIQPATLAALATGAYMDAGEPVVLLGDSGTGKSHLLIALGLAACEQGRRVRYVTTAQLVNELVEAADERQLSRVVARYGRLDLLLLDELGYVQVATRVAPSCCSRSSPNAKNAPRSASAPTCRSANGAASSPTHGSSPPSSTASPSTPTSSKPAPSPTGCAPAKPARDASRPTRRGWTPPQRSDEHRAHPSQAGGQHARHTHHAQPSSG